MWKYVIYEMKRGRYFGTRERRIRTLLSYGEATDFVANYKKLNPDAVIRIAEVVV